MTQTILITLISLAVLMAALFGSAYASDQQLTLLGLSFATGTAAHVLGYSALSR